LLLTTLLAAPDSCETREMTGMLTAREVRVGDLDSNGPAPITLEGGSITLTDAMGHTAILSASSIRFFSPDGKLVAETPASAAP
jgi:hypothetical protein